MIKKQHTGSPDLFNLPGGGRAVHLEKGKRCGRFLGRPHMGGIYRLFAAGKNIALGSPKGAAQHRDGVPCLRI